MGARIVFHIDFDYFYAQCEELRRPKLKTKPVSVCMFSDRGGDSGAIATANYTAREFGVKSGIPISFARKMLKDRKDAIFLPADFDYYSDISEKAMSIMEEFADIFEYVGRDEAYLDVTKRTDSDFGKAGYLAQQIKNAIKNKLKLGCSVGVSPNKLLSKIASDHHKPDGLTIVPPEKIEAFLEPLKIRAIPGIGKKSEEYFSQMNIQTVGELKKLDVFSLNREFGRKTASYIFNAARGISDEPVKEKKPSSQYSKIMTLKKDSKEYEFLLENTISLCCELHEVIKKNGRLFRSVGMQFVQSDMSSKTKSRLLKNHTASLGELQKTAQQLLREALEDQTKTVRRLGVKVSELSEGKGQSDITSYF
ncbi:MAG: DNA polymerase IV [Thaumarchaeota archaeon]|nr:DNA polymerase IV [Nitrososphaerota archaeon]